MYANKVSSIILTICFILGMISYGTGKGIYATSSTQSKDSIGLPPKPVSTTVPKATGHSSDNKQSAKSTVVECDGRCKINELISLGIRSEIATALIINCKALADDPVHCIKFGASLVKNESGGGYKCRSRNQYNCSGMDVSAQYKSYNDGIVHWIGKYNKHWYKAKNMGLFYSVAGVLPPSRYCTSEESSGSKVGCPNGLKTSAAFYNKISF